MVFMRQTAAESVYMMHEYYDYVCYFHNRTLSVLLVLRQHCTTYGSRLVVDPAFSFQAAAAVDAASEVDIGYKRSSASSQFGDTPATVHRRK